MLIGCSTPSGFKSVLMAEADVYVSEAAPDRSEAEITEHVLSAGIGRGLQEGRLISYLRFDLSEIPKSTLFYNILIDSGQLQLLAHSFGLATPDKRFLVSVSNCTDSKWSEAEMTWNLRVCSEQLKGQDSVIIKGSDLPAIYTWDVTQELARARADGQTKVTLVIEAHRLLDCPRDPLEGKGCPEAKWLGFVRFSSRELAIFGVSAVPTLVVFLFQLSHYIHELSQFYVGGLIGGRGDCRSLRICEATHRKATPQ